MGLNDIVNLKKKFQIEQDRGIITNLIISNHFLFFSHSIFLKKKFLHSLPYRQTFFFFFFFFFFLHKDKFLMFY